MLQDLDLSFPSEFGGEGVVPYYTISVNFKKNNRLGGCVNILAAFPYRGDFYPDRPLINTHSTPLECGNFGIRFSILTAKQYHAADMTEHIAAGIGKPIGYDLKIDRM